MGKIYDLIIVGAGPAGLSAGIYAAERKLDTLILEANIPGGQPATLYPQKLIYDYPGIADIPAGELAEKMKTQAVRIGVVIEIGTTVREISQNNHAFQLQTETKPYPSTVSLSVSSSGRPNRFARAVLIAVGMGFFKPRKLGIAGEELAGVYYIFPDYSLVKGKRVLCVGGGETAIEGAAAAANGGASKVYLVHRREEFRGTEKILAELKKLGVVFLTPCELKEIKRGEDSSGTNFFSVSNSPPDLHRGRSDSDLSNRDTTKEGSTGNSAALSNKRKDGGWPQAESSLAQTSETSKKLPPSESFQGSDIVKKAVIVNNKTKEETQVEVDLICIHIGFQTDSSLVERWGLAIEKHAVVVDRNMQTSRSGIFACGDVTIPAGEYKRITIAQGQAAQAVHGAYKYLKQPYWK